MRVPPRTVLHPDVRNLFDPTTAIRFDLARGSNVMLRIYDVAGRLVRALVEADMVAGHKHSAPWNGVDDGKERIASGIYLCRLDAVGLSVASWW